MSKSLSKAKMTRSINGEVDYNKVMKSGYMDKKKVGSKKWEHRFCLLTVGHLVWFEDFEAREKQKAKGVIDLAEVQRVYLAPMDGENGRGDLLHLELAQVTYAFGDASKPQQNKYWKEQVDFVLKNVQKTPAVTGTKQRSGTIVE